MDNRTRRDQGMAYIADETVFEEMMIARKKVQEFNRADGTDLKNLQRMAYGILGKAGANLMLTQPFYCDYGTHIKAGDNFFVNYNCTILDVAEVVIGDNVFLAPNVAIYTAGHPVHPEARNSMYEYGFPVKIGSNCWIGGNVVITPGVTIGEGCVIGAGSVVTKDIPPYCIAAGNPCKVIREITEEDRKYYYKRQEFDEEAKEIMNQRLRRVEDERRNESI